MVAKLIILICFILYGALIQPYILLGQVVDARVLIDVHIANETQVKHYNCTYVRHNDFMSVPYVFHVMDVFRPPDPSARPSASFSLPFGLLRGFMSELFQSFSAIGLLFVSTGSNSSPSDYDMYANYVSDSYSFLSVQPSSNFLLYDYNKLISIKIPLR